MADPLKPVGTEVSLSTANDISLASLVRVVNMDASNAAVITLKSNTGTVLGTFTLGTNSVDWSREYIAKLPTDTLTANNASNNGAYVGAGIKAVSVAYR